MAIYSRFPIILSENWLEGYVGAFNDNFIDYVDKLLKGGLTFGVLPPFFKQLYDLSYYAAQVHNGGHSQFLFNSQGRTDALINSARLAARQLTSTQLDAVLARCGRWLGEHHEIVSSPDFGTAPIKIAALEELDSEYYSLEKSIDEYDDFLASQSSEFNQWLERKKEQSVDEHSLRTASFLFQHPDTEIVPVEDYERRIGELIAGDPFSERRKLLDKYRRIRLPPISQFALAICLGQVKNTQRYDLSQAWEKLDPEPRYQVTATNREDEAGYSLARDGQVFILRRRKLDFASRINELGWTVGATIGLISELRLQKRRDYERLRRMMPNLARAKTFRAKHYVEGRELARTIIDYDPREILKSLCVPSALCAFKEDATHGFSFACGVALRLSIDSEEIEWRYDIQTSDGEQQAVLMEIDQQTTVFTILETGKKTAFSISELKKWTDQREADAKDPAIFPSGTE